MLFQYHTAITCDADGDFTTTIGHNIRGKIVMVKFTAGTLDTGGDLTLTGTTSSVPILTLTAHGTDDLFDYPRAFAADPADGSDSTDAFADIWLYDESITVLENDGGNLGAGAVTVWVDEPQRG